MSSIHALCFWKRRPLGSRPQSFVCLHVHTIRGLPLAMYGRVVVVGWRTRGCKGERTLPVEVCEGTADFDEIFLHYCNAEDVRSVLKGVVVSVSLVDAAECSLGIFQNDMSEMVLVEGLDTKLVGKTLSFDLEGIASGGVVSVGVYCRMIEEDSNGSNCNSAGHKQSKTNCFSCLPDFRCLRSRGLIASLQRVAIVKQYPLESEDEGFITIEKEGISTQSRCPPSDDLRNTDDNNKFEDSEDEKPCLLMDLNNIEQFDVDNVEDEFLRKLKDKYWKAMGNSNSSTNMDLDCLIKEAEMELTKAAGVLKSRIGGAVLENEEYEELMKRWGSNEDSSLVCSLLCGFGSPI